MRLSISSGLRAGGHPPVIRPKCIAIDVRGPYVTPELNNELQCNVETCGKNYLRSVVGLRKILL